MYEYVDVKYENKFKKHLVHKYLNIKRKIKIKKKFKEKFNQLLHIKTEQKKNKKIICNNCISLYKVSVVACRLQTIASFFKKVKIN